MLDSICAHYAACIIPARMKTGRDKKKKADLPMKTQKLLPALILMAATAFAAPAAFADPFQKTFTVTFSYNRAAPAEAIYQRVEKTAHRACRTPGPLAFKVNRATRACEGRVKDAIVMKMNRLDVAALHHKTQPVTQVASLY
jgi:UrcA family protein